MNVTALKAQAVRCWERHRQAPVYKTAHKDDAFFDLSGGSKTCSGMAARKREGFVPSGWPCAAADVLY